MTMLADLAQDLRLGLRALRRSPGFTALVVVTLGLGIGGCAALAGLYDALFLRPLPVRDPGALVLLSEASAPGRSTVLVPGPLELASHPLFGQLRGELSARAGVAAPAF